MNYLIGVDIGTQGTKAVLINENGEVLSPPATRALDYFPVKIEDQKVWVDTNPPKRRNQSDPSQIPYA